ncbi:hypothetical protein JCM6882_000217 [Rhodosporidiobolus microsporus]
MDPLSVVHAGVALAKHVDKVMANSAETRSLTAEVSRLFEQLQEQEDAAERSGNAELARVLRNARTALPTNDLDKLKNRSALVKGLRANNVQVDLASLRNNLLEQKSSVQLNATTHVSGQVSGLVQLVELLMDKFDSFIDAQHASTSTRDLTSPLETSWLQQELALPDDWPKFDATIQSGSAMTGFRLPTPVLVSLLLLQPPWRVN